MNDEAPLEEQLCREIEKLDQPAKLASLWVDGIAVASGQAYLGPGYPTHRFDPTAQDILDNPPKTEAILKIEETGQQLSAHSFRLCKPGATHLHFQTTGA